MSNSWKCPFCSHFATIKDDNLRVFREEFELGNKYGHQAVKIIVVSCPNEKCREYTLGLTLHDHKQVAGQWKDQPTKKTWHLIPQSSAKVLPDYVPAPIISDYLEACSVRDLSPKASATLARRCLQGMIRDFWKVKKKNLAAEIKAIEQKVDGDTWSAIDAVRKVGNIGAHMEKNIDIIVDVEPNEANLLIGLIETLVDDWYVVRHDRATRLAKVVAIADAKDLARKKKVVGDIPPNSGEV